MPLTKLQFRPGINREVTSYTNEGGWLDCDFVRFQKGFPEKIGGWQKRSNRSFLGTCRGLHPWVTLNRDQYIGVATNLKFYIDRGGAFNDITPLRITTAAGDVTFAATDGSYRILVTDVDHGAVVNDFVSFSDAVSLGGNITADILNQEYQIIEVPGADTYYIEARTVSSIVSITLDGAVVPVFVLADSSDVGDGGSSVVGAYQVNAGLNNAVSGSGWDVGPWSREGWGDPSYESLLSNTLRLWSQDNFGEDLLLNARNGGVYYWEASTGLDTRAVNLTSLAGSSDAPTIAKQIMVSDRDRHVLAFGCDGIGAGGIQDPLLIRFSSQESITDWTPTATNTAGDLRLGSGSEIVLALETRQQVLVFTDTTLYAMQYLGAPFTFGVGPLSENITIASPRAAVAVNDNVFWMGLTEFYVYTGSVQRLPCSVRSFIFDNSNVEQLGKVTSGANTEHSEVWWFYPSTNSNELDRYVVYNYLEEVWHIGSMGRTSWMDRGIFDLPIAANIDGYLYYQEAGFDDGTTNPVSPINSFIQSSPIDIAEGQQFMFISRVIPDVTFKNSTASIPKIDFTLSVRNFPDGTYLDSTTKEFVNTQSVPVDARTEQLFYRLRGRQMSLLLQSNELETTWRLGSPRIDTRPDGRR
jgi:hypothetical protein